MSKSSITPPSGSFDAMESEKIEHIATHDKVPGHSNYYEKDGLRTYGDDEDHDHEPEVRHVPQRMYKIDWQRVDVDATLHESSRHGIFVDRITNSCVYFWQVLWMLFRICERAEIMDIGAIPPYIYSDIGGVDRWVLWTSRSKYTYYPFIEKKS